MAPAKVASEAFRLNAEKLNSLDPDWKECCNCPFTSRKKAAGLSFRFPHSSGDFFLCKSARWRSDAGRDWESDNFLHSWALSHLQVMGYLEECEVVYGNWSYFRAIMGGWLGHKNLFRGFENSSWQTLRTSQVCLPNWCDTLSGHTELEITNKQTDRRHKPQECDLFGWMDWAYGSWKKYGSPVTNVPQVQGNHRFQKMADIWCDG